MANNRRQRVESQLQRLLADLIRREVKDPRVGNVTITAVRVTPDLSAARVLFVPFGAAHSPEEVAAGLQRAAGYLRGAIGRRLALRQAPRLEFEFDTLPAQARRLTDLIDGAVRQDRARRRGCAE
ncbi:MAG: 30S ribosome-binding factor RbfA [Steroidobacteraceae bacterium]|nr:30S ribosome-binding factor RbfA [Steroidobacteraceae bacterium]MDW8260743.1 30S ribosome-binding factor RbfA [Gammaproteobacteria bacterium]